MAKFSDILAQHSNVLIDFSAVWCGPCQVLSPILKEVKSHYADRLSVIKIDVDKNNELARHYHVQGVPTLILFKEGKQVWRQSGVLSKESLIEIIDQHS